VDILLLNFLDQLEQEFGREVLGAQGARAGDKEVLYFELDDQLNFALCGGEVGEGEAR
jgi:hypothetical protein